MATIDPKEHRRQIEAYKAEHPHYAKYAEVLKRVLEKACGRAAPLAIVQARPKSISSFAEKALRKHDKYPDAVHDLTDLCGARVILHTREQVDAVRRFINDNFTIVEEDDVQQRLGDTEFGYLSIHYIVAMKPGTDLGVSAEDLAFIGTRRAEVQVRTLLQHAWADILHDRLYKNKVDVPKHLKRVSYLLAALMEEGDRAYGQVTERIDTFFGSYSAYMTRQQMLKEIATLAAILENEPEQKNKSGLSLQLARLEAACRGDYARVTGLLQPFAQVPGPYQQEIQLELGYALCRLHRGQSGSGPYLEGQALLKSVADTCALPLCREVLDPRQQRALRALALTRLAWSFEVQRDKEVEARDHYRQALAIDPANPYLLAESLRHEIFCMRNRDLLTVARTRITEAVEICRQHAAARMELPRAYFTQGRFQLLLEDGARAFAAYARGVRHCLDPEAFAPPQVIADELEFLHQINFGRALPAQHEWIRRLLLIAQTLAADTAAQQVVRQLATKKLPPFRKPVIIIAGGATGMQPAEQKLAHRFLAFALDDFGGTVISGGTAAGVPGAVGEIAGQLKKESRKKFHLVGYRPSHLPDTAPPCPHCDDSILTASNDFSYVEILQNWADLCAAGIQPREVRLLGINGGTISAAEYRLALALGATVGIVRGSGREADELFKDADWMDARNLIALPSDAATVRAFVHSQGASVTETQREELGKRIHANYVKDNNSTPDPSMLPWEKLAPDLKQSNREQAAYAAQILTRAGYALQPAGGTATQARFAPEEIELMAELEHGRWNRERLEAGWKLGRPKNVATKTNPSLVSWRDLPEAVREYDRKAVLGWPALFIEAGLEIRPAPDHDQILARTRELLSASRQP